MKVFYGSALQGLRERGERAELNSLFISEIKSNGAAVLTEHTTGKNREESAMLLEKSIGPLPPPGIERTRYVRGKMIGFVEAEIDAAVFEVSSPSLGTGIEFAHAYLRPRMGLSEIPMLALYQEGYWPNGLSTMIKGIKDSELPNLKIASYKSSDEGKRIISSFLQEIAKAKKEKAL